MAEQDTDDTVPDAKPTALPSPGMDRPAMTPGAGSLRMLPPATRVMVRERRRRLCGSAEGRVLEPTGRSRPIDFRRADEVVVGLDAAGRRPGSLDTVVSVLWLAAVDRVEDTLDLVAELLDTGGELVFLEPVREPGIGRVGQRLVSPALRRAAGWRVDRDIPALLRASGWAINDLERIPMPRFLWPLHGLVEGRARLRAGAGS
jgi:hypothetical protein